MKIKENKPGFAVRTFTFLLVFNSIIIISLSVSAQKSAIVTVLSKHGIDQGILDLETVKVPEGYAYDIKQSTTAGGKTTITEAKFDPSSPTEEQWTVRSVNGKSPSKGVISSFRKERTKAQKYPKIDDASYRIEKETSEELVISYKFDATSLGKDVAFMKDCRTYMSVNPKKKKLSQLQTVNEKPVKVAILNADKFELISKFVLHEQSKHYFPQLEKLNVQAKFVGQPITIQTTTEFGNYIKK
ncbi:hypothetical protein ACFOWA_01525 [Pedobacter lithocola]|uniref:DUF3108 domain-containing protein n=1 Tax=Pedobacter lithocola TaxID=1908239 RepID=A0ABV8P6M6_9SPHI